MNEVLVAIFETEEAALRATTALTEAGIPRPSIRRYRQDEYDAPAGMAGSGTTTTGAAAETRPHQSKGGFWSWLLGEDSTADYRPEYDKDYEAYRKAAEAGRTVVAVTVRQEDSSRILDLLDAQSPLHVEDSGPATAPGNVTAASTAAMPAAPAAAQAAPAPSTVTAGMTPRGAGAAGQSEEVIPLAEEHVDIGKRRVQSGSTQVRRYVTERPVERQVNLRDEHVEIEHRKPVAGSARPGSDAFQERTVEVRDTREEPVVERRAEVGEEVVVRKEIREHPETVKTTERKEKVDVERRGND